MTKPKKLLFLPCRHSLVNSGLGRSRGITTSVTLPSHAVPLSGPGSRDWICLSEHDTNGCSTTFLRQVCLTSHTIFIYRVFIKYCVFSLKFLIFLNSASSAASLVFYLPSVCKHTDTEGKQRKARVRNILKSLKKNNF